MAENKTRIINFNNLRHRDQVIRLWEKVFAYQDAHNLPELSIDQKIHNNDGLFFVAEQEQKVVGTIMAGYDGHRGWIYSITVDPKYRKLGIGSDLLAFAQKELTRLGCLKVNLQIKTDNEAVVQFYLANGFTVEQRISMGRKLY